MAKGFEALPAMVPRMIYALHTHNTHVQTRVPLHLHIHNYLYMSIQLCKYMCFPLVI